MSTSTEIVRELLDDRLEKAARRWVNTSCEEVAKGVDDTRFCILVSQASRYVPRRARLAPTDEERAAANAALADWDPERWTLLEAARVALVLARPDLEEDGVVQALEEAFRYADVGELCGLYRSLAHLPGGERFVWRAGEGCRTNMTSVFEAVACDTPYPSVHFDPIAWNQAAIKAVFVGAPLWRLAGLDGRLSEELARMALDLADERRSAGRPVQHELWLCLGPHGGERALTSIELELEQGTPLGRRAAAYALARAGERARLETWLERERDADVRETLRAALEGPTDQGAFRALDERELETQDA